jgi:hypothetical protein
VKHYGGHHIPSSVGTARKRSHQGPRVFPGAGFPGLLTDGPTPPPDPGNQGDFIYGFPSAAVTTAYQQSLSYTYRRLCFRFGIPRTGQVDRIYVHLKCGDSPSTIGNGSGGVNNYGAGDTGRINFRLCYADLDTGWPDTSQVIATDGPFKPGWYTTVSGDRGNTQNSIYMLVGDVLTLGDLVTLEIWNSSGTSNYFSINSPHDNTGPRDAFAANNLDIDYTTDGTATGPCGTGGMDPRTCTGWSDDSGATWDFPGTPPYAGGQFHTAYGIKYSDSTYLFGKPYHYGGEGGTSETQIHKFCGTHTFTHLSYIATAAGSATNITIQKNGATVDTLNPSASSGRVRVALTSPISVINTDVIRITFNSSGRNISGQYTDGIWAGSTSDLCLLNTTQPCYDEAQPAKRYAIYLEPIPPAWLGVGCIG